MYIYRYYQIFSLNETLTTMITWIIRLSCISCQILYETLTTVVTWKILLSCMGSQMVYKTNALTESLTTVITWLILLSCMGSQMFCQIIFLTERLVTLNAWIMIFSSVGRHMYHQITFHKFISPLIWLSHFGHIILPVKVFLFQSIISLCLECTNFMKCLISLHEFS